MEEARRRARVEFGGLEGVKDDCRDARGLRVFDAIGRDTRYAVRLLRRSPGFTATALATLAICIGANLTIFAVVDALLLRPLPFPDADRLMSVYNTYPKAGVPNDGASLTNYYDRRGKIAAFEGVSAYRTGTAVIGESGATEQVPTMRVSADYFATLGVTPVMGRAFTEAEMEYGADARRHRHRQLLAAAARRRSGRARTHDSRGRRADHGRGHPAARLPLSLIEDARLLPAGVKPGGALAARAAFRQFTHGRAVEGRRVGCSGAGRDRRA